ncbi:MAG: hypothetical protein COA58_00200 [Bacteroidetes bacterium]|nr:MAG: hypothetical protein COA58_00200 [Bacteroidota bacterium]
MRFNKPAYPIVHFSELIWVQCPSCSELALATTELPKYTIPFPSGHKSRCGCKYCGFQQSGDKKWSGYLEGIVNQSCGHCGTKIYDASEPTKEPYKSCKVTCMTCNDEREYPITWHRYREDKSTDPYFGFELWLQTSIKDNVLWLYNLDHLNYLKGYVSAKLREDNGRYKYSMIANLPQWIKSSKNRELIVKKLNKLEQEFLKKANQKYIA